MDPFKTQARQYLLSRPRYPKELVNRIVNKCPQKTYALDVACGSGQLTRDLVEHFDHVLGIDRSEAQLKFAPLHERIQYKLVPNASDLSPLVPNNTVDCVTCAQAFHWMEPTSTLAEFHRVLKPHGGVLGVLGYGMCSVLSNPGAQAELTKYYVEVLGSLRELTDPQCLWECDRRRLDSGHALECFSPPFSQQVERYWLNQPLSVSPDEFITYLKTQSVYQELPNKAVVLRPLEVMLGNEPVHLSFPFWLILATKI